MKILYAVQGTGNGHISRAKELLRHLDKFCSYDVLVSGTQHEINLDCEVKHTLKGLTMCYNSTGGVSIQKTLQENSLFGFRKEVKNLDLSEYDLVINDFEPVSAWACKIQGIPCVALSHQAALLSPSSPKAGNFLNLGWLILKYYAPSRRQYGFHFKKYDQNIFSSIIRSEIKELESEDLRYTLVYLPAYSASYLLKLFRKFPETKFEIFVKNLEVSRISGNCTFHAIGSSNFESRLSKCSSVICSAGFELPSEALYLSKKLLVVPIHRQYEQACNAKALNELGVTVIRHLRHHQIAHWLRHGEVIPYFNVEKVDLILRRIIEEFIEFDLKHQDFKKWELEQESVIGLV